MLLFKHLRNLNGFDEACSNPVANGSNESFLHRLFIAINRENVLLLWLGFIDLLDNSSQIGDMNGGYKIGSLSYIW